MAEQLISFIKGVQYTGSNGAAILAEVTAELSPQSLIDYNIHIVSESGGVLVLGYESAGPATSTAEVGDWVIWATSTPSTMPDALLNTVYIKRSDLP